MPKAEYEVRASLPAVAFYLFFYLAGQPWPDQLDQGSPTRVQ